MADLVSAVDAFNTKAIGAGLPQRAVYTMNSLRDALIAVGGPAINTLLGQANGVATWVPYTYPPESGGY